MTVTHNNIISITILLDAPPVQQQGFAPLLLVDEDDGNTLDGDRYRVYTSSEDVSTDETAGYISAATASALNVGFGQTPAPSEILVARVDTVATESYADALDAVEAETDDFYAVSLDSRTESDQTGVETWVSTRKKLALFQTSTVDWKNGAYDPFSSEHVGVCFHDTDTEDADVAWACNRLAFAPDSKSVGWDAPLSSVDEYSTAITSTEKSQLEDNNANVILPLGTSDTFIANEGVGVNVAGRQISEIVTKHWFGIRLQERVSQLKVETAARGDKITVSASGSSKVQAVVDKLFAEGERIGHFVPGQTTTDGYFPVPNDADRDANRIRGGGKAQLANNAGEFEFEFTFTRDPVVEA